MDNRLLEMSNRHLVRAVSHFSTHAGGITERGDGYLLAASPPPFDGPLFNAVVRTERATSGAAVISRARRFFAANPRQYTVWVTEHADQDLEEAARLAGLSRETGDGPGMALLTPVGPPVIPAQVELIRVSDHDTVGAFGAVAAEVFKSFGPPAGARVNLTGRPGILVGPDVAAYLAYAGGTPSSCGMVVRTGSVAGIYFVGTVESARGRGLGELVTRMAAHAGFELGARTVVLQSTLVAAALYRRIGFADFGCYVNYIGDAMPDASSTRRA
jgi:ribosomal protein S18 acetylase RimI-like enzyme